MAKFLSHYSKWIIAIFGFLVFGLTQTTWLQTLPLWERMEGVSLDVRYTNRAGQPPDPNIMLVGLTSTSFQLDDLSSNEIAASPTLQLMQQPWPWDRRVYAAVLDKLMNAGAKVVFFDFVFASQTDGDDEFAQALHKYKDHVVIGEMFADEEGSSSATKKLTAPNPDLILSDTDSVVALVNMWTDPDGVVRQVKYKTSIEHESGLDQFGFPENLIHITAVTAKKFAGEDLAPADDAFHYIDFQGAAGTYRPLAVEQMFVDQDWHARNFEDGLVFSNKIVIVGPMAEIFHDIHPTPFGDMPGPELQAQIIGALLHRSWLAGTSPVIGFVLALLMLWVGLEICLRIKSAILKPILLAVTVFVFFLIGQVAFSHYKIVLPMTPPLFCLIVPGAFGIMFQFVLEQIERVRTRNVLERYVSKNVAKTILEDQRSFLESLSGRKKSVTVLFSDIRGFTSMTESSDAGKLVAQLNEYFLEMVGVVLKESGTLQKFIGDAIMAAWGDTHSEGLAEDARRAVSAALQMRAALVRLNDQWAAQSDRMKLKIGIGVNHGDIIVGNIGHPQRMEFTVLGDGVNLAARLESSTKQFHTDILIGEETEKLTREFFIYRNVGAIAFKGKTKPIETFVVLSDRSQPPPAWLAKYHEAIQLYRGRQFEQAMAKFREAQQEIGVEDFLCDMYIEQCENLFHQGLKSGWDGSFALSEK
ncbi:MAG TPA: adenylate/guanylate cyclase domain-containing protein [Verrucomicrobiae bacterium]|jgi:adenylate cyclase